MSTFFRGWRRKLGCITLVMAVSLFGAWVRSHVMADVINVPTSNALYRLILAQGYLICDYWADGNTVVVDIRFDSYELSVHDPISYFDEYGHFVACRSVVFGSDENGRIRFLCTSCWWIIAPLTLVSAYLILWKP